jgi:hypothetical protein
MEIGTLRQFDLQIFEGDPVTITNMLSQVHIAKAASAQPAQHTIVAYYFAYALQALFHLAFPAIYIFLSSIASI